MLFFYLICPDSDPTMLAKVPRQDRFLSGGSSETFPLELLEKNTEKRKTWSSFLGNAAKQKNPGFVISV